MAWALIIVLTYSRHSFVWPTFSQKLVDVIEGLEAAWAFFEGVPKYLVIDNFPAAVAGPDPLHPRLTRGFLEYSQHRGFISDPARVRHPRDKPRVERGVPYVRERFFKGGEFRGLSDMRSATRRWCLAVAGQRVHGTTRRQPRCRLRPSANVSSSSGCFPPPTHTRSAERIFCSSSSFVALTPSRQRTCAGSPCQH